MSVVLGGLLVLEEPLDYVRMLIYADWLEDNGMFHESQAWHWFVENERSPEKWRIGNNFWWWQMECSSRPYSCFIGNAVSLLNKRMNRSLHCGFYDKGCSIDVPVLDAIQAITKLIQKGERLCL